MLKKVLALALAGAMVIGSMSLTAFGAAVPTSEGATGMLTVSGLADGDVAHFYKLVAWNGDDPAGTVSGWYGISPFDSILDTDTLSAVLVDDPDTTDNTKDAKGIWAELAGELARAASGEGTSVPVGSSGKAELNVAQDGLGAGMYMVLVTPKDNDVVYNPVFVSSDFEGSSATWDVNEEATYSDEAAAKKSTVTLEKVSSAAGTDYNSDDADTTAIGDKVHFNVTTTIPAFGEVYESPSFVMTDSLTALKLDFDAEGADNAAKADGYITVNPATYMVEDVETPTYTVTAIGDSGYTLTFDPAYLKTLTTPQALTVSYDAFVTTDAEANVNPEDNTVQVVYSNNPNDESDKAAKFDETHHYTFTLDADILGGGSSAEGKKGSELVKIGRDAQGNPITESRTTSTITTSHYQVSPLAGAEFKLYTDSGCNTEYIPKNPDGTAGTEGLSITSGADGRFKIEGLDAGTYYLKETKAPTGFVKDPTVYTITITPVITEKSVTKYWNGSAWVEEYNADYIPYTCTTETLDSVTITVNPGGTTTHTFINDSTNSEIKWVEESSVEVPSSVVNTEGVELPSTGGIGTTLFYAGGAVLVLLAGVLLVSKRRIA